MVRGRVITGSWLRASTGTQAAIDQIITNGGAEPLKSNLKGTHTMATQHKAPEARLTIRMTGRRPLSILRSEWPRIGWDKESGHDGEVECQANRTWEAWISIRRNAIDGRTIVCGESEFRSNWSHEPNAYAHAGHLLAPGATDAEIAATANTVAAAIAGPVSGRIDTRNVSRDALASLPAEEL